MFQEGNEGSIARMLVGRATQAFHDSDSKKARKNYHDNLNLNFCNNSCMRTCKNPCFILPAICKTNEVLGIYIQRTRIDRQHRLLPLPPILMLAQLQLKITMLLCHPTTQPQNNLNNHLKIDHQSNTSISHKPHCNLMLTSPARPNPSQNTHLFSTLFQFHFYRFPLPPIPHQYSHHYYSVLQMITVI